MSRHGKQLLEGFLIGIGLAILIIALAALGVGCGQPQYYRVVGVEGPKGDQGDIGPMGPAGSSGHSVVFNSIAVAPSCANGGRTILIAMDVNDNLTLDVADENLQSNEICNGANGSDGATPVSPPFMPTELVSFCGNVDLLWSEVGFRLANGLIVASFSENANGKNTRWTILVPRAYTTTDGYGCNFTITPTGEIVR